MNPSPVDPGLCGECDLARVVETRRGSRFYLCERSRDDASYARYPRLPVVRCAGFVRRDAGDTGADDVDRAS